VRPFFLFNLICHNDFLQKKGIHTTRIDKTKSSHLLLRLFFSVVQIHNERMMMAVKYSHICKHSINTILFSIHTHKRLEFRIYDKLFIQKRRKKNERDYLTSSVRKKDELKVKTLTNTIHAIRNILSLITRKRISFVIHSVV